MHAAAFATLFCDLHVNTGSNGVVPCRDAEEPAQLSAGRARDWMAEQLRTAASPLCKVAHGGIGRGKAHANIPPGPLIGAVQWRNPITGIAGCCARAVSGHATAAPPSS